MAVQVRPRPVWTAPDLEVHETVSVSALEQVSRELGLALERRPIERTELLTADECRVAGTITELTLVEELDGFRFEQSGLLSQVRQRYLGVMRGKSVLPGIDLVLLIDLVGPLRRFRRHERADVASAPLRRRYRRADPIIHRRHLRMRLEIACWTPRSGRVDLATPVGAGALWATTR